MAAPFNTADDDAIMRIPLTFREQHDTIIWRLTSNGEYSLKKAYKLFLSTILQNKQSQTLGNWNKIWNLDVDVPSKVKHLSWRAARDCLLTRNNLNTCGISFSTYCVMCEQHEEDNIHVFFRCEQSIKCWQELKLWPSI